MIDSKKLRRLSTQLVSNPNNPMDSFRKNLQMYLSHKELTLNELSELADISQSTLRNLVYGNCNDFYMSNAIKLANVLKVSVDELVGCETLQPKVAKIIQVSRQLPSSFFYFIKWISDYYYKELYEKRVSEKSIPVMKPVCGENLNLQMTNQFDILDISNVDKNLIPKIFMGIRIPCDIFVPLYYPGDILLLANDRNPRQKEDFIISTEKNLWISNKIGDKYFSARDKTFRLSKDEITVEIGYVAAVINSKE